MIKRKGYFMKKRIFQKEQLSKEGKEHQVKKERGNFKDNHKRNGWEIGNGKWCKWRKYSFGEEKLISTNCLFF